MSVAEYSQRLILPHKDAPKHFSRRASHGQPSHGSCHVSQPGVGYLRLQRKFADVSYSWAGAGGKRCVKHTEVSAVTKPSRSQALFHASVLKEITFTSWLIHLVVAGPGGGGGRWGGDGCDVGFSPEPLFTFSAIAPGKI